MVTRMYRKKTEINTRFPKGVIQRRLAFSSMLMADLGLDPYFTF